MARYDLFTTERQVLVVDVQSDYLMGIATRLVVPLLPKATAPRVMPRLNPEFVIDSQSYVLLTQQLSAADAKRLRTRPGSLAVHADEISQAIDMLLYGF